MQPITSAITSAITPVILCGGSGTRLWPRSRKALPKPFLPLIGDTTLFEATLARCADPALFAAPMVVTGVDHVNHVLAQGSSHAGLRVIVEPCARNTAAAIALAAACLPPGAIMLVCPSDHHIADAEAFLGAVRAAAGLAAEGWMVALGIAASAPETGYGYILRGAPLPGGFRISRFVEKPDLATAMSFLADGNYSWNGGIFAFRAGAFLDELALHRPAIAAAVRHSAANGNEAGALFHPDAQAFAAAPSESVDYAVMEETARAAMVPVSMGWSDIGNWQALRDSLPAGENENRVRGNVELIDCKGVLAETDGPRISIIGMEDVAVVVNGGEVLVTSMAGTQKVGKLGGAANQ